MVVRVQVQGRHIPAQKMRERVQVQRHIPEQKRTMVPEPAPRRSLVLKTSLAREAALGPRSHRRFAGWVVAGRCCMLRMRSRTS
jgi:hypothetical protein